MAMKSNGKKRLCNDLRRINESFDLFMIPLPTLPEVFDTLAGSKYYSTIDMCAAFSQIPITQRLSEYLTMTTPFGNFRPTRLVFGWKNSPGYFANVVTDVMRGIPDVVMILSYTPRQGLSMSEQSKWSSASCENEDCQ
jgi:hypothetical protein